MASEKNAQNRLGEESSPYLLQHAGNPVDWHPWSSEAFDRARQEDKPVFVSIGYATCHWCHVMAHESFEDEEIAALMNSAFVNVKVDREERPDIDNTYMLVCQMLTGSGGWPLNVILTPDKEPFYAATYIPRQGRHGRPGMRELIPWISQLWENEREKISESTKKIVDAFQKSNAFEAGDLLSSEVLHQAYRQYEQQYDTEEGGFGNAPKFPSPHNLMLLLRYARQNPAAGALEMVEKTLLKMRRGGIFDHIGLGFHRYSTDREWLVPHFEKMLYDQAMLLMAYTEAWQLTKNSVFKKTAEEITRYLFRRMQNEQGGFYSAEDADSEGEEGKFYVWSVEEIRNVLPAAEAELVLEIFNFRKAGNYRDEVSGQYTGNNIPHLTRSPKNLAEERNMEQQLLEDRLESIRKKLLEARAKRIRPLLDDKILTDWNGLLIAGLAKAARVFNHPEYLKQAKRCFRFIHQELITEENLKHRYRHGKVAIDGHADDYAFLVWGLIELYQTTFESSFLETALKLNNQFVNRFWDRQNGAFYFTSETGENLIGRKKEIYDGAMPSSNSVAMLNLLRLGRLTGDTELEDKAASINRLFSSEIRQAPTGFGQALQAVDFAVSSPGEIIISGFAHKEETERMVRIISEKFLPNSVFLLNDPRDRKLRQLVPFLDDFDMKEGKTTAYVCRNYSCELPTDDPREMADLLEG